ncbi:MAG: TIGR04255 family protein [Promethearchaeota archaeon]|jgi:uncharacterized protein (TIGR04255 family)
MVDPEKFIERSFINPFLSYVAFEIRFPAMTRVLNDYYNFQEKINEIYFNFGEEFPFVDLPEKLQAPQSLRRIVFSDENNETKVRLTVNSINFFTKKYTTFEKFEIRVKYAIEKFLSSFDIKKCLRIGLRYSNTYSLYKDREKSISEVIEMFEPLINTKLINHDLVLNQKLEIKKKLTGLINITLRTIFQYNKKENIYEYILDFDTYIEDSTDINNYLKNLVELRLEEKKEFLRFVKNPFLEKMEFI